MIMYRRNGKVKNVVLGYMNHLKVKLGQTIKMHLSHCLF